MKLYDFQVTGVKRLVETKRQILADDMGLGKTVQALTAAHDLGATRILVVCPNAVKGLKHKDGTYFSGWAGESYTWFPEWTISIVEGDKQQRLAAIRADTNLLIIHYDVLRLHEFDLTLDPYDVIIFDESHRLKSRSAKVTQVARHIAKCSDNLFFLSGTPILNRVSEIWTVLNMLYPKDKRFTSFWRFCGDYCYVHKDQWGWVIDDITDPDHPKIVKLKKTLEPIVIRRTKPEVLKDMPPKTIQQVWVELTTRQRRIYTEMEKQMLATLESGEQVSVTVIIAQIMRLKQIALSPGLISEVDPNVRGAKFDALLDILESLSGKQVVVFSQFRKALEALFTFLETKDVGPTALYTGAVDQRKRSELVESFQRGGIRNLLVTTQAGGTGVTLTAASTAIFLDKLWTPALNSQAQDRLHRIGQKESVTIIELLAADTIEERIETMLISKQNIVDAVMETEAQLADRGDQVFHTKLITRELLSSLYPEVLIAKH